MSASTCAQPVLAGLARFRSAQSAANIQSAQKLPALYRVSGRRRSLSSYRSSKPEMFTNRTVAQFRHREFSKYVSTDRLIAIINASEVGYVEPDCDGPDYLTTSMDLVPRWRLNRTDGNAPHAPFPNDPCLDELWGHKRSAGIRRRLAPCRAWSPCLTLASMQVTRPREERSPAPESRNRAHRAAG
jgi:hypothetical protein